MKKKWFIFAALIFSQTVLGAPDIDINALLRSDNQDLVKSAVQDGMFLIESSYQLADSAGQRFGVDNLPYFNRMVYLGIALDGADVMPQKVFQPWQEDAAVEPYKEDYQPVLYSVNVRTIQDSVFHSIDSIAFKDTMTVWNGHVAARKKDIKGFAIDTTVGKKDGWVVIVIIKNNKTTLQCIRKSLKVDSIGKQSVELPNQLQAFPGGIYIVPVIERVGQVSFKLCGIVEASQGGNRLMIQFPFVGNDYSCRLTTLSNSGKLRPIKQMESKSLQIKKVKRSHKKK